mgnify:CR=1 FL=1
MFNNLITKLFNKLIIITFLLSFMFSKNNEFNISEIYIEGNTRMSDQDIKRNARLYAGMEIKGLPEIQQAIKRLWKLERFSNIEIIINSETIEGLILTIIAEELPTLELVNFKLLTKKEKSYLFEYHLSVYSKISKYLNKNEKKWLISLIK